MQVLNVKNNQRHLLIGYIILLKCPIMGPIFMPLKICWTWMGLCNYGVQQLIKHLTIKFSLIINFKNKKKTFLLKDFKPCFHDYLFTIPISIQDLTKC
jgi:hypothetical protein